MWKVNVPIQLFLYRNFNSINVGGYGNCFTFNTIYNEADPYGGMRVTSLTGPTFGLSLVLNLEQINYMRGGQTKQAGARMVVHEPDLPPFLDEFGKDVHPATLTNIAVQEVLMTRQPAPYTSNCTETWLSTNYSKYTDPTIKYTLAVSQDYIEKPKCKKFFNKKWCFWNKTLKNTKNTKNITQPTKIYFLCFCVFRFFCII